MELQGKESGRLMEEGEMKPLQQQQDQILKPPMAMQAAAAAENQQHHHQQPQQPQKCPRCESLNTKFCYYNNYSLTQPRYFCKTCRRYWTQGGTLRNVPVGGGCRKGKRTKTSNSGGNQQQINLAASTPPSLISTNSGTKESPSNLASQSPLQPLPPMGSYYPGSGVGHGFLSSLAAIQSLNQIPQGFNQHINIGDGNFGGGSSSSSSNMALLQGFNVPTFSSSQQQQIQQSEFFQMGNRSDKNVESLFPSQESLIQPTSSRQDWHHHQSLINTSANNPTPTSDAAGLWNINNSSNTNTTSSSNTNVGASMNPYQWPDLPGYGPPS